MNPVNIKEQIRRDNGPDRDERILFFWQLFVLSREQNLKGWRRLPHFGYTFNGACKGLMSSVSERVEGWNPGSQQCPFIAVLLITTAGWATDDGKEEETNKSYKIPFSSCRVPFLSKAGRHLFFTGGRVLCSAWGGDGKPYGGPHRLLSWEKQAGPAQPPLRWLVSLIQCPGPAVKPAWVFVLTSAAVNSGSTGDTGCAGPLEDPTEEG